MIDVPNTKQLPFKQYFFNWLTFESSYEQSFKWPPSVNVSFYES